MRMDIYVSLIAKFVAKYSQEFDLSAHVYTSSLAKDQSTMTAVFKVQAANESIYRHRTEQILCHLQNLTVHIDRIGLLIYLSLGKHCSRWIQLMKIPLVSPDSIH